ncbi:MAG: fatty acid desaturase [Gammaproteobacteria bacterium]
MYKGLLDLEIWAYPLVALALTHITIVAVTVYLHRHQAHRAVELHPIVSHFFRLWLWLTTSMNTREWAAVHRKHHATVESVDDPHSPRVYGIATVLLQGAELYRTAANDKHLVEEYGYGTPDDWVERNLYSRYKNLGIAIMFVIDVVLFGALGLTVWAVQMAWIPFFAAGVINGAAHYWGYRNFEVDDASTNLVPWGVLIGGEELHNNHHAFASSAKFSQKPWEFDLGWAYIRAMAFLRLASVRRLAPKPSRNADKIGIDVDTVRALLTARMHVMAEYAQKVVGRVYREELRSAQASSRPLLKPVRRWLAREALLDASTQRRLASALEHSQALASVHRFKHELQKLWRERAATPESLVSVLQEWCRQAEATGIAALAEFAAGCADIRCRPPDL